MLREFCNLLRVSEVERRLLAAADFVRRAAELLTDLLPDAEAPVFLWDASDAFETTDAFAALFFAVDRLLAAVLGSWIQVPARSVLADIPSLAR